MTKINIGKKESIFYHNIIKPNNNSRPEVPLSNAIKIISISNNLYNIYYGVVLENKKVLIY